MKTLLHLVLVLLVPCVSWAFQIDLPKHYHANLEKKRLSEAEAIWRELDRNAVENAIRTFVASHQSVDGLDLNSLGHFNWSKEGQAISCGRWQVLLSEWELTFPALRRIRWNRATLVLSLAYDWRSKELKKDGNGELRLYFSVARDGALFAKKIISPRLENFDYGEVYVLLPFGGVELRKVNEQE